VTCESVKMFVFINIATVNLYKKLTVFLLTIAKNFCNVNTTLPHIPYMNMSVENIFIFILYEIGY
jgi:hypothetical protein